MTTRQGGLCSCGQSETLASSCRARLPGLAETCTGGGGCSQCKGLALFAMRHVTEDDSHRSWPLNQRSTSKLLTGQSSSPWPLPSTTGLSHSEGCCLPSGHAAPKSAPHTASPGPCGETRIPLRPHASSQGQSEKDERSAGVSHLKTSLRKHTALTLSCHFLLTLP